MNYVLERQLMESMKTIAENLERIACSLERMNKLTEERDKHSRVSTMREQEAMMKMRTGRG